MSTETPSGEEQPTEQGEGIEEAGEGRSGENVAPGGITDPPPADAPTDVASEEKIESGADEDDHVVAEEAVDSHAVEPTPDSPMLRDLLSQFEDAAWHVSHGQDVFTIPKEQFADLATAAKAAGFEMCVDVTAVDWLRSRSQRFEVIANLLSLQHKTRLRIITTVDRLEPSVPSLTPIWPGAGYAEREVFDMFGIDFAGHPDLTRILMPDEWEGHPLRKDFAVGSVPVQFKDSNQVR